MKVVISALLVGLMLAFSSGKAQPPIPLMANAISICMDVQSCVITAISDPNAVFQFGAGTTWCQTLNTPKTLPISVNYSTQNQVLCKYDPAPGAIKTLVAQQRNSFYTITYTLAGQAQPIKTIPGLIAPVSTFPALCTTYSDGTFTCAATGAIKPAGTN